MVKLLPYLTPLDDRSSHNFIPQSGSLPVALNAHCSALDNAGLANQVSPASQHEAQPQSHLSPAKFWIV